MCKGTNYPYTKPASLKAPTNAAILIVRRVPCGASRRSVDSLPMFCQVGEAAHVEDAVGYPCRSSAVAICSDCGTKLCAIHAELCSECEMVFCPTCRRFHQNSAAHVKKAARTGRAKSGQAAA